MCMGTFRCCEHCSKKIRLSEDIGLFVNVGVGNHGRGFLCRFFLIVPEASPRVFGLFGWVYCLSWKEKMLEAEIQGRKDDAAEAAFLERLRKGEEWRRASLER